MNARIALLSWAQYVQSHTALSNTDAESFRAIDALMMEIASCIIYSVERNNNGPVNARLNAIEKRLKDLGYSPEDKNG